MELDSKIESFYRLRKKLSYFVAILWIIMLGPALPMVLSDVGNQDSLFFVGVVVAVFFFVSLSVYVIRNGKRLGLFALSCFTYVLVGIAHNDLYDEGVWDPNWSSFVFSLIVLGAYLLSMFLIARHLWLMRKARIRDEKLAVQEG